MAADASLALALPPLPAAVAFEVLARVPADTRMRCAEVSRTWRVAVADVRLWRRLDLTVASGVARADEEGRVVALLRAGAARARGELHTLLLDGPRIGEVLLLAEVAAHAGALRELNIVLSTPGSRLSWWGSSLPGLKAILQAAPQLRNFCADVRCESTAEACALLRNEHPYGPLRLRFLRINALNDAQAGVLSVCTAMASHASLTSLGLCNVRLDVAAFDAVVDAALAHRLSGIALYSCLLSPASAPALIRLLGSSAITALSFDSYGIHELNATAELGDALRRNNTLTSLELQAVSLWDEPEAAAMLLDALAGHTSLRTLNLGLDYIMSTFDAHAKAILSAALSALVAANAPALTELNFSLCPLELYFRRPLVDHTLLGALVASLPRNTHLHTLDLSHIRLGDPFVTEQLLPAVRANTSLRQLNFANVCKNVPAVQQAMQLVAMRCD